MGTLSRARCEHDARFVLRYYGAVTDVSALQQQIEQLRAEHRQLDEQISALTAQPSLNQLELARLKRRKLRLKDEIQLLVDRSIPDIIA